MYHNVLRYEYLTFQTQIHLHKQYIFDTNIIQSEYAFIFPFSINKNSLKIFKHLNIYYMHSPTYKHGNYTKLMQIKLFTA